AFARACFPVHCVGGIPPIDDTQEGHHAGARLLAPGEWDFPIWPAAAGSDAAPDRGRRTTRPVHGCVRNGNHRPPHQSRVRLAQYRAPYRAEGISSNLVFRISDYGLSSNPASLVHGSGVAGNTVESLAAVAFASRGPGAAHLRPDRRFSIARSRSRHGSRRLAVVGPSRQGLPWFPQCLILPLLALCTGLPDSPFR